MSNLNKMCPKCKQNKPKTKEFFHQDRKWFHAVCKICRKQSSDEITPIGETRRCTICKTTFPLTSDFFHKTNREKYGLRSQCKKCRAKNKKEYTSLNRDKIRLQDKKYRSLPSTKVKLKLYRYNNKNNRNQTERIRRSNDPVYKLIQYTRASFNRYFTNKKKSSFEYVGITVNELKNYLESLFQEGMSWENYGLHGWHIDHIKPLSAFNFKEHIHDPIKIEQLMNEAWHYTNLQPLWAKDNLTKSSKYESKQRS